MKFILNSASGKDYNPELISNNLKAWDNYVEIDNLEQLLLLCKLVPEGIIIWNNPDNPKITVYDDWLE
jgi:hypothetical protein